MAPQLTWDDQPLVQHQRRPWCHSQGLVIVFDGPANWGPEISNKHLADYFEPFGRVVETWTTSDIALYDSTMPSVPTGELHVLFKLAPGVETSELPGWMTLRQYPVYEPERFLLYYEGRLDDSERSRKDEGSSTLRPSPAKPSTSSPATTSARQPQEASLEPSIS